MAQPRILTFNFHEPYLCLMAKTGLEMDVGHYNSGPMARQWRSDFREPPPNLHLLQEGGWRPKLQAGRYDVIIAQNEMNAIDVARYKGGKILLCHNRRTFLETTASYEAGDARARYDELLEQLQAYYRFVFISPSKRDDYGIEGPVILPGIDLADWGGYTGEEAVALRVGNTLRARNLMFDVDLQEAAVAGLPNRVVGENPDIPGAAPARTFAALQEIYRSHRCMLHVTREAYEDGYNLAMLEAMATGMPVVALANATCPLEDGVNGLVGVDAEGLHERLQQLLADPELARKLGAAGRETVAERYSIDAFAQAWRDVIESVAGQATHSVASAAVVPPQPKVVLNYLASPTTTGRYIEEALRECAEVQTAGFRLPEEILKAWGFPEPIPDYNAHAIDLPFRASCKAIFEALPKDFAPDFFFYVDSGDKESVPDIDAVCIPKAAYFIDTHVQLEPRIRMAADFDVVFIAQKAQLESFQSRGIREVYWLPLACSPALHAVSAPARDLDVAYVGSLDPNEGPRRPALMAQVADAFPNHYIGKQWPADMAKTYARSKIVVNAAYHHDVNMRVFEGMASGALLITDEAVGLEDLFEDRKHLVIYRSDDELIELVRYYLEHEDERAAIATAGQERVLREHSYQRRMERMLEILQSSRAWAPEAGTGKTRAYYECPRHELIPHIPLHASRILDVGCGAGVLGNLLKSEYNVAEVVGLEIVPSAAAEARGVLDQVLEGSIETMDLPFADHYFDCIICADVLEHLVDPTAALAKLKRVLALDGSIVISIPNIQYHEILTMLCNGAWTYMDAGLMDSTHLRFFTKSTVDSMIRNAGLEVGRLMPLNIRPESYVPLDELGGLPMGKLRLDDLDTESYERLRTYQWAAVGCHPGVDRLVHVREAWTNGQHDAAYLLAENAVGVDEAERYHWMARALAKMGRLEDAEAHFLESLKLRPAPETAGNYGILLLSMNRTEEAREHIAAGLAADGGNDRLLGARGLLALVNQDYDTAFADIRQALEASFEHRHLLPHLVAAAEACGKLPEAEAIYQQFASFFPGDVAIRCSHAQLLDKLGDRDGARAALEEAAIFAPDDPLILECLTALDAGAQDP